MAAKSEAWKQANRKYRSERTSSVQVQLTLEDKSEWTAYAEFRGLPLATLIREAMKQSMQAHEWKGSPQISAQQNEE